MNIGYIRTMPTLSAIPSLDPNAPADARNRKNVVVRAFVFF